MDREKDLVYLDRRAGEERRAAFRSGNQVVRNRHLEFASAYEFRVQLLREEAGSPTPELWVLGNSPAEAAAQLQHEDEPIPLQIPAAVTTGG